MKPTIIGLALAILGAGAASAQTAGEKAAGGDNNQAVATTSANAMKPAKGANSFTAEQAQGRLEKNGFAAVSGLTKDADGIWRGTATKGGQQANVWVDYKGNVGQL